MYNKKGFTLLEMVVVITIAAILSTIGFISLLNNNRDARDTVRKSHLTDIQSVLRITKAETGTYPTPTNDFEVTYSGSTVWIQGEFGNKTLSETGKIFGDLLDPKHSVAYTYSTTENKREYQIAMVFEAYEDIFNPTAWFKENIITPVPQTHASTTFDPAIYQPIIWLNSDDIDGDGDTGNNPSNGANLTTWINKGTLGNSGNPTLTGNITFESAILNGYDSVVVDQNAGILLNNSDITKGEIYYVLNKTNKAVGAGLRGVQEGYHIGPWHNCVDSININKSPEFYTNLSGGKKDPYFYSFYTDDENYIFRTNGNNLGFAGPTHSISGISWAFNAAGHDVESKSKKKGQNCSSAGSSSADIAIGEVLIFDADNYTLTEEDRLKIEGYLAWKWGLNNKLPSDHPYKNAPPEGPSDPGEVEVISADSGVHVSGDYNGMLVHTSTGSTHYVLAAPSIITYDSNDTDLQSIISNRKFVYDRYHNIPSSYSGSNLTMSGGFNFYSEYPLLYEGTKAEIGSYGGLKDINTEIRYKYRSSILYSELEGYLSDHSLTYLENILSSHVGINPIKPYYCSDIQDSKFIYNIAKEAGLGGNSHVDQGYGLPALVNGVIETSGDLDKEYHSEAGSGWIELTWDEDKPVGFVRIYNSVNNDSDKLTGGVLTIYDASDTILYQHTLWDTSNDYLVDFDLIDLGEYYQNVRKIRLETQPGNSLHIREIEAFIGGDIQDGYYKVDEDGAGGLGAYEVYCDMTTDGGGWTRVGDNYISRGDFSNGQHGDNYSLQYPLSNVIVPINSPVNSGYALRIRDVGETALPANLFYEITFDNLSPFKVGNEIRLSAWVADETDHGGTGNIFDNVLSYSGSTSTFNSFETLATQDVDGKTWTHQMVRIPITQEVENFVWNLGKNAEYNSGRELFVTDLRAEIYYK